jgi:hypothetical protein
VDASKVQIFCGDRIACITVTGSLSVIELIEALETFYTLIGSRHLLWDFTAADVSKITDEHFSDIAALAAMRLGPSEMRKTAYAAGDTGKYTRLCRYITVAFNAHVPSEYAVFMDRQSAVEWLQKT